MCIKLYPFTDLIFMSIFLPKATLLLSKNKLTTYILISLQVETCEIRVRVREKEKRGEEESL